MPSNPAHDHHTTWAAPQVPGGRYICGYSRCEYTVEAMGARIDGRDPWVTVTWQTGPATGTTVTHGTAWDQRWDRVVTQPSD
jgi:hypothetical protein